RGDAGIRGPGARLVAGDEAVHRRLLLAADRGNDVFARKPLFFQSGEVSDQVPGFLLGEEEPEEIRRLVLLLGLVDIDDRELRLGEVRRHAVDRVRLGEAYANGQVLVPARERREVRSGLPW